METTSNHEIYKLAIYSVKSRLGGKVISLLVADFSVAIYIFFCILSRSIFLSIASTLLLLQMIIIQIFLFGFLLLGLVLLISMLPYTIFTIFRLLSHKPALLITDQGIDFNDLPVIGNTSLSWNEIASLSVGPGDRLLDKPLTLYTAMGHLCFGLNDHVQFLSRFHPLRRFFIIGLGSLVTSPLIHVPPWYFSEPVGEILSQMQDTFQDQIRAHGVQVFGSHSEEEFN